LTPAFAQTVTGSASGASEILLQIAPFGLIFVIMYFLVLRPQQRKAKDHADLIKNVRRGDSIVTSGGLIGKITKVIDDAEVEVEIAQNVRVRIVRGMIADVRSKGEPVKEPATIAKS
jgi:preprotein translocase subunit YajC